MPAMPGPGAGELMGFPPTPRGRQSAPPGKMAKPSVRTVNSHAVQVKWTAPADVASRRTLDALEIARCFGSGKIADHPVTGYRLRYWAQTAEEGRDEEVEEQCIAGPPEYTEIGETYDRVTHQTLLDWLRPGTLYVFEVTALNSAGSGPWSDPSECFVVPHMLRAPRNRALMKRGASIITAPEVDKLRVNLAPPYHRRSAVRSFEVLCSKDPSFKDFSMQLQAPGESTSMTVDGLEPNTVYYFKHRAVDGHGPLDWSDVTSGTSTMARPPERPRAPFRLGEPSAWLPREVHIRWDPPESYNVPIQHYSVRCSMESNMRDAVEVPVGGEPKLPGRRTDAPHPITLKPQVAPEMPADGPPSSPGTRRPGFNRGNYALTQLKVRGLQPSNAYFFQVKARNQIGESDWSPPSDPIKTAASPPARCGVPRHVGGSKRQGMIVRWPVPYNFGVPINRFDVRVAKHASMTKAVEHKMVRTRTATAAAPTGSPDEELVEATIEGCWDPGQDHFYQVRALSSAGVGDWSPSSKAMQVEPECPLQPEAPHSFISLHQVVLVRWRPSDCRGSPITGYRLRYSTSQDMWHPVDVFTHLTGTGTECPVANLNPCGIYYFQVAAVNAVGSSNWSPPSRSVRLQMLPPTKMAAPHVLQQTPNSITLGFTPPGDLGTRDGLMVQSYTLQYSNGPSRHAVLDAGDERMFGVIHNAKPSGVEIAGLRPGEPVACRVFAINEYGEGEASDVADFLTELATPAAPGKPQLAERTYFGITLSMTFGGNSGLEIKHFGIEVEEMSVEGVHSGRSWTMPLFPVSSHDEGGLQYYQVTGLRPGVTYCFRGYTVNGLGPSPTSEASDPLQTEPMPPEPVEKGLSVEDVVANSFRLHWERPYQNGSRVTRYHVQWGTDEEFRKGVQELTTADTTALLGSCTPSMLHFARVAGINAEGRGHFGPALRVTTTAGVPKAPIQVRVTACGPINTRVGWMLPFECGSAITGLFIRFMETATDRRPAIECDQGEVYIQGRKRFCSIEPLFSQREYTFQVAAENSIGLGPWSELTAPARIGRPQVPTAPSQPVLVTKSPEELTLSWNASESMGSDILEQVVQLCSTPDFAQGHVLQFSLPPWNSDQTRADEKHSAEKHSASIMSTTGFSDRPTTTGDGQMLPFNHSMMTTTDSWADFEGLAPGESQELLGDGSSGPVQQSAREQPADLAWRQSERQAEHQAECQAGRQAERQAERQVERQVERQAERQAEHQAAQQIQPVIGGSFMTEVSLRRKAASDTLQRPVEAPMDTSQGTEALFMEVVTVQVVKRYEDLEPSGPEARLQCQSRLYHPPRMQGEYTLCELSPGTSFYARVASRNGVGMGQFSPTSAHI